MNDLSQQLREDGVFDALQPDGKPFMKAHRLPASLNPFAERGIEIDALTVCGNFPHIKAIPTFQMMTEDRNAGRYEGIHTIVVDSSGNTAHAVVRLAHTFGFKKVKVIMSTEVPQSKAGILRAFGDFVDVTHTVNPNQIAKEEGERKGHYHLNQYTHLGNMNAHERYTGPEVIRALGGLASMVGAVAIALGSGGTAAGVGRYLNSLPSKTRVIGVRPTLGQQVPGARDKNRMETIVTLPWKEGVSDLVEVSRKDAFIATRQLWSAVEPQPGPTSGLAYQGLIQFLNSLAEEDLQLLQQKRAAFICPDDGRFYSDVILAELDSDQGV